MGGYWDSRGVVWLDTPAPAHLFDNGRWGTATAEQAAHLIPGQDLTPAWDLEEHGFVLLPAPGGDGQGTVAGIAWETSDDDGFPNWVVFNILDDFADRVPGASAVIWGVGAGYEVAMYPEVFAYTADRGFIAESLPMQHEINLFHPAQRRTAVFTRTQPDTGPAVPVSLPDPLDSVPVEHRRLVLAEAVALLEARDSSPEAIGLLQRLADARLCGTCQGRGRIQFPGHEAGPVQPCTACARSGLVPPTTAATGD